MSKLKLAELFYSIQGEGRFMGVPSVFLRVFGCNFKCAGFGMERGQLSQEVESIAFSHGNTPYRNYNDLPLVTTGCDSYASWDPRFKDLSPLVETDAIVGRIMEMLPFRQWKDEHLVITGGEPLLGWQRCYPDLLDHPNMVDLKEITFETNGTQPLSREFASWIHNHWHHDKGRSTFTFSVSPKLSVSGEKWEEAIQPEVIAEYDEYGFTYLKFVIASESDAQEALDATSAYRAAGFTGPVYLMPVGGVEKIYTLNNRRVAELAMKYGLRYSDRLQVPLFKNEWGT